jgi:hypothetical protein
VKIGVLSEPGMGNKKQRGIVPNIVNSVIGFNSIYISISLRGVLMLGEVLLGVLLRVVVSKGEFSLGMFSTD